MAIGSGAAIAGEPDSTLIVAGPRTPESLDQEYPPTEAVHEARRNINEPLLRYASKKGEDGIIYEDFSKIEGDLAEAWEVSPDKKSITFHLRKGVKSSAGNELTADDVMWTFARGWNLEGEFSLVHLAGAEHRLSRRRVQEDRRIHRASEHPVLLPAD